MFKFLLTNFDENFNSFNSKLKLAKDGFYNEISRELNLIGTPLINTLEDTEPVPSNQSVFFPMFAKKSKFLKN